MGTGPPRLGPEEAQQRIVSASEFLRPSVTGIPTALSALGAILFVAILVMLLAEALDAHRRRR
jgi:hypothetical protein